MPRTDINSATTTDFENQVDNFQIDLGFLDSPDDTNERKYSFPDASEHIGYYQNIPELKKAIDALASWTVGKGWETNTTKNSVKLENIQGEGVDSLQTVLENMIRIKKITGDAFSEIVRNDDGEIINMKPLNTENMTIVVNNKGIIKRYEYRINNKVRRFEPEEIFHLSNDRIFNQIHGTSVVEACKDIIDSRKEALDVKRKLIQRSKALGIAYYDTDDAGEISYANEQIEKAVNKGEMLGLPKDTVQIEEYPTQNIPEILQWIQYLENFFYQAVGVPKIILGGSQEFTEASSKIGYLTFEQVYMKEQRELEAAFKNQIGIEISFKRPVSLQDHIQDSEEKNTGQLGLQPKEVNEVNTERE